MMNTNDVVKEKKDTGITRIMSIRNKEFQKNFSICFETHTFTLCLREITLKKYC